MCPRLRFVYALIALTLVSSGSSSSSVSKIDNPTAFLPQFAIYPLKQNQSDSAFNNNNSYDAGSVFGWRSCGGPGKVVDIRMAGCKPTSLCTVATSTPHYVEVDFVPSEDIQQVGFRSNLVETGAGGKGGVVTTKTTTLLERRIPTAPLLGGQAYQSQELGGVSDAFKGETVTLQYVLFRVADNSTELCGEAEFRFV